MSNTPAIPEEVRQSIKDYSAGRSPRATVQADCIFGYSLAQKEISTLEATIQDQDSQIIAQKKEIERLKELLKSNYQDWHKTFYRTVSTITESQIDNHFKSQWEIFAKNNNIQP